MTLKLGSEAVAALYLGATQVKAYLGSDLIADTGGGGGGLPDWLPIDARAFVDLMASDAASVHAYAGGQIVTDVTTLLAAISNVATTFDPNAITVDGAGLDADSQGASPSFIGPLLSDILHPDGCTIVFEVTTLEGSGQQFGLENGDSSNYNHELTIRPGGPAEWGGQAAYFYDDNAQIDLSGQRLVDNALNRIAITLSATNLAISANGETTSQTTPPDPTSYAQIAISNTIGYVLWLRKITVYPVKDDADLPALSAFS